MSHNHGGEGAMSMASVTTTAAAAASTAMSGGHGGGMGGGSGCKISMLWNWYTIDSCFLASSWKITSTSVFAGSCIGVVLLVISLEMLRRAVKEYDRFLVKKYLQSQAVASTGSVKKVSDEGSPAPACVPAAANGYRPTIFEQAIRALLHMLQFAVAYFVMLLAMYYNGYIIICIFIGAYIGSFIFHWETIGAGAQTSATKEATVCCG
ncbi:Copper Transporter integral membrane protein that functions in high affinity copper transport [Madurella fahalii]|uniref:Copper transport protein n=1 Tax=Madurella fahalii TaxID=1157608 RepID=A0ABQ0GTM0_9PEZI